ncbi:hypothetical protein N7537_012244 [Penicillium hordei]|uniref:Zn(2)-C6 fungal-type domain-containing protein n=1 Tax=Penicillium hordei TaxID=40994 RepID=A0AAD6DNP2_9EURO|nr:uncharacterized protein N7537_012244 [Penicillium hordei]KAJ5589566.1 hypothetical protein N7537_012244 [Penicillium hordei]
MSCPHGFNVIIRIVTQKYRRKEHLNRHLNRHNGGTNLTCPHCESVLTRNDLLRRHVRTHHPQRQVPPSQKSKACTACHARKGRCEGGLPCKACQHRGITCVPAPGNIASGQQCWIDEFHSLPPISTIDNFLPDASSWIAHKYIDIYFDTFHPAWPFLHRSTFNVAKDPCVLVQSIIAMGLWDQWCAANSNAYRNTSTSLPITTFQSVLLNIILALFMARENSSIDLTMRYRLPDDKYKLLTALVQTCRRWEMFYYPNMIIQHNTHTPLALVYLNIEETKRFGLALYKTCRLSTSSNITEGHTNCDGNDLLTLADLSYSMPDNDDIWNAPLGTESEVLKKSASSAAIRDNGDPKNWISEASGLLHDVRVGFDWI